MLALVAELRITPAAQHFFQSLGGTSLCDFAVAARYGYLSYEVLVELGVAVIPALKFMEAVQQVDVENGAISKLIMLMAS